MKGTFKSALPCLFVIYLPGVLHRIGAPNVRFGLFHLFSFDFYHFEAYKVYSLVTGLDHHSNPFFPGRLCLCPTSSQPGNCPAYLKLYEIIICRRIAEGIIPAIRFSKYGDSIKMRLMIGSKLYKWDGGWGYISKGKEERDRIWDEKTGQSKNVDIVSIYW